MAVLVLELKGFQKVVASQGAATGDHVLNLAGMCLQRVLRKSDFLCRFDAQQFAAILPGMADREHLARLCERINERSHVVVHKVAKGRDVNLSIGIAQYPQDGDTTESMLNKALQALDLAKQGQDSQYHFAA